MMMPIPEELIALLGLCAAAALGLLWVSRDRLLATGPLGVWRAVEEGVGYFLMLAMLTASIVQVVARYALADTVTLPWTEEFGRLALIWAALWGAAAVQRSDDHIAMTVLADFLPGGWHRALRITGDLLTLVVLLPIVWLGWQSARALDIMFTISLGMPLSLFAYPVPVAGALMLVFGAVLAVRRSLGLPVRSESPVEV